MSKTTATAAAASGSSGTSLGGLTFLVLLVLKLTNNIDISWFWVIAPLWIGFAFVFVVGIFAFVIGIIALTLIDARKARKHRNRRWVR